MIIILNIIILMNKFIISFIVSAVFIIVTGCSESKTNKRVVDLSSSLSADTTSDYDYDALFRLEGYAPIESSDSTMLRRCGFLFLRDGCAGVYDSDRLMILDEKTGNVSRLIGRVGRGPGEYQCIDNVSFADSTIVIRDLIVEKTIYYSLDGTLIKESDCYQYPLEGGKYLIVHPYSSDVDISVFNKDSSLLRTAVLGKKGVQTRIQQSQSLMKFNVDYYFKSQFSDSVFRVTAAKDSLALVFDEGDYRMSDNSFADLSIMNEEASKKITEKSFKICGDLLFVEFFYKNIMNREVWTLHDKKMIFKSIIKGEDDIYGLPIKIDGNTIWFWPDSVDGDNLYASLFYAQGKLLCPELTEDDNPVMVHLKSL